MNPKVKFKLTCSKGSMIGRVEGSVTPDLEIHLLGMASRLLAREKSMNGMRLDRFTITLVMPKTKKKKS